MVIMYKKLMRRFVIKGNICYSKSINELLVQRNIAVLEKEKLISIENGKITISDEQFLQLKLLDNE